jgi:uncharacterized membrane protein YhaH (DUF805 family)
MGSHYFPLGIKDIFNARGRINRMTFFMYGAALEIINIVVKYAFILVLLQVLKSGDHTMLMVLYAAYGLFLVVYAWGLFCISAKRLHDLNLPALIATIGVALWVVRPLIEAGLIPVPMDTNSLLNILTLVSGAFGLCLLLIPGTKGSNCYGERALRQERAKAVDLNG